MVQNQLQVGWPTVFIISLERRNPKSFHLNENLWNLHSANALGMQVAFDRRITLFALNFMPKLNVDPLT